MIDFDSYKIVNAAVFTDCYSLHYFQNLKILKARFEAGIIDSVLHCKLVDRRMTYPCSSTSRHVATVSDVMQTSAICLNITLLCSGSSMIVNCLLYCKVKPISRRQLP